MKLSGSFSDGGLKVEQYVNILKNKGLSISDSFDIVSYILNIPYSLVTSSFDKDLDAVIAHEVLIKLADKVPVAYITGRKEFFGREFNVDSSTLIPRPETELLVEEAVKALKNFDSRNIKVLDLCTGSGCILISLICELNCGGIGIDNSLEALSIARLNALRLEAAGAEFICADVLNMNLADFITANSVTVLTVNPPYISEEEYGIYASDLKAEPYGALVAGDGGLLFYKKILYSLSKLGRIGSSNYFVKNPGGTLLFFFEIGYNQGDAVKKIAAECGLKIFIKKDLGANSRLAYGAI